MFTLFQVLEVKSGIAIPAGEGDRLANWPMIARASSSFHGGPYFSDVAIQMEAAGEDPLTTYGQLRLIFSCDSTSDTGDQEMQELAFLQLYESNRRPERVTRCTVVRPVSERLHAGGSRDNASTQRRREPYLIIQVANILRVVQLIPHYGGLEEEEFLVNHFKF